jgi:hypothetical protein
MVPVWWCHIVMSSEFTAGPTFGPSGDVGESLGALGSALLPFNLKFNHRQSTTHLKDLKGHGEFKCL